MLKYYYKNGKNMSLDSVYNNNCSRIVDTFLTEDAQSFYFAILRAKTEGVEDEKAQEIFRTIKSKHFGAYVHAYSVEEYQSMKLVTTESFAGGLAVKDMHTIVSVFKTKAYKKNLMDELLPEAISLTEGGCYGDCFNGFLPTKYSQFGFEPVAKLKFNKEYAPEDWNYERDGEPDIIFMAHHGQSYDELRKAVTDFSNLSKSEQRETIATLDDKVKQSITVIPYVSSYEEGEKHQKEFYWPY